MSASNTAPQIPSKPTTAVRNAAVSFVGQLDENELLTGTPTVTVLPATGAPTIGSIVVSTATRTINGEQVPAGKAVQFTVTGGTANVKYTFTVTCGTNSTPAQTLVGYTRLRVKNS